MWIEIGEGLGVRSGRRNLIIERSRVFEKKSSLKM